VRGSLRFAIQIGSGTPVHEADPLRHVGAIGAPVG